MISRPALASILVLALASSHCLAAQGWALSGAPITNWLSIVSSADGSKLVACSTGGGVCVSTNAGQTWATNTIETDLAALAASADGMRLAAVGHNGRIYTSNDGGTTWFPTRAPVTNWSCIASSADGVRLAAAGSPVAFDFSPGLVYVSTNSGADWALTSAPDQRWTSLAFSQDGARLVAACSNRWVSSGSIYVSADAGMNWMPSGAPAESWIDVVCSADGLRLAAGIESGTEVYISEDAGSTWVQPSRPYGSSWWAFACSADAGLLVALDGCCLSFSAEWGNTWTSNSAPDICNWNKITSSADGCRLAGCVGWRGGGIYTWQTTPHPVLNVVTHGTSLLLSWVVPSMAFVLQQSSELDAEWADVPTTPVLNYTNLHYEVNLATPNGTVFYRLASR